MRVADIMTRDPVTLAPGASLAAAQRVMEEEDVRHLPVVEGSRLVGVLSDRDLLTATGWTIDPMESRTVRDVMTAKVATVPPDFEMVSVSMDLLLGGFGCLPVVEHEHLVGILSELDLLRAFRRACEENLLSGDFDPPAEKKMTRKLWTVGPGSSVAEARELCRAHHVRHVPVVDGERLIGMVSDRDLRRLEGRHRIHDAVYAEALAQRTVTIAPRTPVSVAARIMLENKFGALPVTEGESLLGILTVSDLVDHCANTLWEPDRFRLPRGD